MQVETYECPETAAEPVEASEEAIRLMNELGFEGQKSLVSRSTVTDRDTRNPYPEMTQEQRVVYTALCPEQTPANRYARTAIPLRVLQVAAHAHSLNLFTEIYVWDKQDSAIKDPVLVAKVRDKFFILARWGEELESWPVLVQRAIDALRKQTMAKLLQIKETVTQRIAALEATSITLATDANLSIPSYYN